MSDFNKEISVVETAENIVEVKKSDIVIAKMLTIFGFVFLVAIVVGIIYVIVDQVILFNNRGVVTEHDNITAMRSKVYTITRDEMYKRIEPDKYQNLLSEIPRGGFTVNEPYIVFTQRDAGVYSENVVYNLVKYSEGFWLNDKGADGLKTIIYSVPAFSRSQEYREVRSNKVSGGAPTRISSYAAQIFYYDVESGEFIGYDYVPAPPLPDTLNSSVKAVRTSKSDVLAAINERLH